MHQSKLLRLLKKVPKSELKNIERFLSSPYHNTNTTILQLFRYLCRYHPKFESPKLSKEAVFKKLFPQEKEFRDRRIRKLQSDLVKLLEVYMVIEEVKKDNFLFQSTLANAFDHRNIFRYFESTIKNIQKELNDPNIPKNLRSFLAIILINRKKLLHPTTKVFDATTGEALASTMDNFFRFSVLAKLQFMAETFERAGAMESIYQLPLLEETMEQAKIYTNENVIFEMYIAVIDLIEKKDEYTFRRLKDLYFNYSGQIKKFNQIQHPKSAIFNHGLLQHGFYQEQRFIYIKLHNFITRKIYEGHTAYEEEQFELYQFGIDNNLLVSNNQMSDMTFINICISGSANKKFDWTKNFIAKYQSYIDEIRRLDAVALSYAFFFFHLENYEKSYEFLSTIREKAPPYSFRYRSLYARCYYEFAAKDDSYTEPLKNYIKNYKQFIRDKSLNENRKSAYINFCIFCKKLIGFKENIKASLEETKQDLKAKLEATYPVIARKWLQEKIEEL